MRCVIIFGPCCSGAMKIRRIMIRQISGWLKLTIRRISGWPKLMIRQISDLSNFRFVEFPVHRISVFTKFAVLTYPNLT